ncbi:uncharacterized protein LOC135377463 [Ornithodoros turicata]|uniref:uncharacterized protein LOC135377463 n=1 Tax=Ornithodoros turicata TaxID=34597 RepID=UPI0031390E49
MADRSERNSATMNSRKPSRTAVAALMSAYIQKQNQIALLNAEIDSAKSAADSLEEIMLANNFVLTAALVDLFPAVDRRLWSHDRSDTWFEKTLPRLGVRHFKQSFRVSPSTFRYLVNVCRSQMERTSTTMREAISIEKRVAIALYRMCSSAEDRTVANLFSVGRSTVNEVFREFCEVIVDELERSTVRLPTEDEMQQHIQEFEAVLRFPHAMGALDGSHFPVSPPKEHAADYHNYKGWYSVILLALVDHRYRFRSYKIIGGVKVPVIILCDQAFSLTPNLMKPFPETAVLTPAQKSFNVCLSSARRVVENAFGRVKARFSVDQQWLRDAQGAMLLSREPSHQSNAVEGSGTAVRNALAQYLCDRECDNIP